MKKILVLTIRIILGAVFIAAGIGKVMNPTDFAGDIDNYRMLPYALVTLMAVILPWVEIIAGLLLIFGRFLLGSSFIIMVLNLVFIVAISSALARGLDIECGCFSLKGGGAQVGLVRLMEDVVFLILAAIVFWTTHRSHSQPSS